LWLSEWLKKRNTALSESANKRLRILAVSISLNDIFLLEYLANQHGWETKFAGSPQEAFKLASYGGFHLILCDRNQSGYPWREVMDRLAASSPQSCILLVSPTNDDYLWWDVLHHRGFDVLIRPYVKRSFCAPSILPYAASAPWLVVRQASSKAILSAVVCFYQLNASNHLISSRIN
jgi:CheY-like chemotaxis protein